jgi:hypothetical protein
MSINLTGILPNYRLVRNFDMPNEEVIAFDAQRYPMVTRAIQLVKQGEQYGIGEGDICIIRLNKAEQKYYYDEVSTQNVFHRPTRTGKVVETNVRVPNKELMSDLRNLGQLSVALAQMEKLGNLEGNDAAINEYLNATFAAIAKLPGVHRQLVTQHVREFFPAKSEG